MNKNTTFAFVSASSLAAGITQAQIISSGPLNLQQNFDSTGVAGRQAVDMTGDGIPDFTFGYDGLYNPGPNAQKPYVDARPIALGNGGSSIPMSGNVGLLAYADNGFPVTPGGTMIDSTYAATYAALTASSPDAQRGYFYEEANGNVVGDWGNTSIVDGYVGIILNGNEYGYLHFLVNPGISVTLEDWAYQSSPGVGIETPVPTPEPSTLALGGVGVAALMVSLRKRKKSALPC